MGRLSGLGPDLTPLRTSRQLRLLWTGESVSLVGSIVTEVALPFQVFRLTGSSLAVGLLGACQLVPLLVLALAGGVVADAVDRRRVALRADVGLGLVSASLAVNALLPRPNVVALFVLGAVAAGLEGFARPSRVAMLPRLVSPDELPAAIAIFTAAATTAMVGGPALAGLLLGGAGQAGTYLFDVGTFAVSLAALARLQPLPPAIGSPRVGLRSFFDGLAFLRGRQLLQGTYLIDEVAMVFGMPRALFPALALGRFGGGPRALGLLHAAPAVGALAASLTARWAARVSRHGLAITVAVAVWGAAIVVFGLSRSLWLALPMLVVAGGADMVSGLFRMRVWNETVPDRVRGRLAGVEWANVAGGPLLGDVEAGAVAAWLGPGFSVVSGGLACVIGAGLVATLLPGFVGYDAAHADAQRREVDNRNPDS